jgi:hypothetical protein
VALLRARLDDGVFGQFLRHKQPLHLVIRAHRRLMRQGALTVKRGARLKKVEAIPSE